MLYLVRHGETILPKGICIGQTDIPMAKKGAECITQKTLPQLLALHLESPLLISSPLQRTMATAKILADKLSATIQPEPALQEINMGKWDGLAFTYIKEHWAKEYEERGSNFAYFKAPDGESFSDVQQRALKAVLTLCRRPEPVVVVTHAGVIRTLLCAANQTPLQKLFTYAPKTGSITPISKASFCSSSVYLQ